MNKIKNIGEEKFNSLFEGIADAIFIADHESKKLIDCNKRAEKLTEYSRKEILSLRADQLHPKDLVERTMEDFKKHSAGKLLVVDTEILTKGKKRVPVSINTSVIKINGKSCLLGIFRDITGRKQAKAEIQKRNIELEKANKLMIGRELNKMIELKKRIKELEHNQKI